MVGPGGRHRAGVTSARPVAGTGGAIAIDPNAAAGADGRRRQRRPAARSAAPGGGKGDGPADSGNGLDAITRSLTEARDHREMTRLGMDLAEVRRALDDAEERWLTLAEAAESRK